MPGRPPRTITWTVAILAGIVAGLAARSLVSRGLDARALARIASADATERSLGWARLAGDDPPRYRKLPGFRPRLGDLTPAAIEAAADVLDVRGDWTWGRVPAGTLADWIAAVAPADPGRIDGLAGTLGDAPVEAAARVAAVIWALPPSLSADGPDPRPALRDAVLDWAGGDPGSRIDRLPADAPDAEARRLRSLAAAAAGPPAPTTTLDDDDPRASEAALLRAAASAHDEAALTALIEAAIAAAADGDPDLPVSAIIAAAPSTLDVDARLAARAAAGERLAERLLTARDPQRDAELAAAVLARGRAEPGLRRVIAMLRAEPGTVAGVRAALDASFLDPEVPPALAALAAEHALEPDAARALAADWIRDLDDRRKRAGAILAALTGGPAEALSAAHAAEDQGDVRLIQRLALVALALTGPPPPVDPGPGVDPRLLAERAAPELRPAAALLRGLAGDPSALVALTTLAGDDPLAPSAAVALRDASIARLVPHWRAVTGRPVGGSRRALALHFDRLDVFRALEASRLVFDRARRRFDPPRLPEAGGSPMIAP